MAVWDKMVHYLLHEFKTVAKQLMAVLQMMVLHLLHHSCPVQSSGGTSDGSSAVAQGKLGTEQSLDGVVQRRESLGMPAGDTDPFYEEGGPEALQARLSRSAQ